MNKTKLWNRLEVLAGVILARSKSADGLWLKLKEIVEEIELQSQEDVLQELMVEVEGKKKSSVLPGSAQFHFGELSGWNQALDDVLSLIKSKRRG